MLNTAATLALALSAALSAPAAAAAAQHAQHAQQLTLESAAAGDSAAALAESLAGARRGLLFTRRTAVDGADGKDGVDGEDGEDGAEGADGADGEGREAPDDEEDLEGLVECTTQTVEIEVSVEKNGEIHADASAPPASVPA